jgi:hypothetical protein
LIDVAPMRISHVIGGSRTVTADLALRFAKAFNQTPQYWLNLQTSTNLPDQSAHSGLRQRSMEVTSLRYPVWSDHDPLRVGVGHGTRDFARRASRARAERARSMAVTNQDSRAAIGGLGQWAAAIGQIGILLHTSLPEITRARPALLCGLYAKRRKPRRPD